MSRYDASGNPEAQFEPGSDGRVLRNLLGIRDPAEMDDVELDLLDLLYDQIPSMVVQTEQIRVEHIREWHRHWLGTVYAWAGKERSVNLGKGGFQFAMARQIGPLLETFDRVTLGQYTPCNRMDIDTLAESIGIVHVEFILIHPFREGNGRMGRVLASVMAMQAGYPEIDFRSWDADKSGYYQAIHAGLDDYAPMTHLVRRALQEPVSNEGE